MVLKKRKTLANKPKILSKSRATFRTIIADDRAEGGEIYTESLVERDVVMVCKWITDISEIKEQPITITAEINGEPIKYTPDLGITIQSDTPYSVIIECKTQSIIDKYPQEEIAHVKEAIEEIGYKFMLITDQSILNARKNIQFFETIKLNTEPIGTQELKVIQDSLPERIEELKRKNLFEGVLRGLAYKQLYLDNLNELFNDNSLIVRDDGYKYENVFI